MSSCDDTELDTLKKKGWRHSGLIGHSAKFKLPDTNQLWRSVNAATGRSSFSLGSPSTDANMVNKSQGWVWTIPLGSSGNLTRVWALKDPGDHWQLNSDPIETANLVDKYNWKKQFDFYVLTPKK
jgi:hypothetical protein